MAKNRNNLTNEIKGLNIIHDPKHGTIFYDFVSKKGYQLVQRDVPAYSMSALFLPIAVLIFYLLSSLFKVPTLYAIGIGIISYIFMKVLWRIRFLRNLPYIDNYNKPENFSYIENITNQYSKGQITILIICSILLALLSFLYIKINDLETLDIIGYSILSIVSLAVGIFFIYIAIKKKESK